MTTYTQTHTHGFFAQIAAWFQGLNAQMKAREAIRTTYNELSALSDRELHDIGITRGELWQIAKQTVAGQH